MIGWLVEKGLFRNANHAIWFLCSIGFLAIVLAIAANISLRFVIVGLILVVHIPPLITSIVFVTKKRPSEIYSKDCIWFNALMLIIYFLLLAFR